MSIPAAQAPPAITGRGLALQRGDRMLFQNLDLAVGAGEALLLTGPNGAGKTSLLLTLAGILPLAAGEIRFGARHPDLRPGTDLHYLGHDNGIKAQLTVAENLRFWTDLYGGDGSGIEAALETVRLGDLAALNGGYLSAGQQKRLSLARLLSVKRSIWLLDEPMAALDADGERLLGRLLGRHLAASGLAVIATHHEIPLLAGEGVRRLELGLRR